jgi:hypothetical protein
MGYQFQQSFQTARRGADANHVANAGSQWLGWYFI